MSLPSHEHQSSRSSLRRRRKRGRVRRRVLLAGAIVVALFGGIVGGGALFLHELVGKNISSVADSEAFPSEKGRPPASSTGVKNILLLGSDSRQKSSEHKLDSAGSQRADTMMLVNISADRRSVSVMSVMRDLWVPVPGHGSAKVNSSLAWGGTALTIETLEKFLGARIDHVATIDFEGLAAMTTALGGVWVDNPQPFSAGSGSDAFFAGGPIKLEGARALAFARERHAFATADFQRVANQQLLLKGMISRALSRDVLADPASLTSFVGETSKHLTVDAGFDLAETASLAYSLRGIDLNDIDFFTIPTAGTGTIRGQSVVNVDESRMVALRKALATDRLAAFAETISTSD